jgi:hypothetical protein
LDGFEDPKLHKKLDSHPHIRTVLDSLKKIEFETHFSERIDGSVLSIEDLIFLTKKLRIISSYEDYLQKSTSSFSRERVTKGILEFNIAFNRMLSKKLQSDFDSTEKSLEAFNDTLSFWKRKFLNNDSLFIALSDSMDHIHSNRIFRDSVFFSAEIGTVKEATDTLFMITDSLNIRLMALQDSIINIQNDIVIIDRRSRNNRTWNWILSIAVAGLGYYTFAK